MYRRCDSLNSVLQPQPTMSLSNEILKPSLVNREVGSRNRILMGSSSVRRVMSNRANSDNVKSFTALQKLDPSEVSIVDNIDNTEEDKKAQKRYSYSRSKSVASGLAKLNDQDQEESLIHDGSYDGKNLLKKKRDGDNGTIAKLFRQVKNIVGKDKSKRIKSSECETGNKTYSFSSSKLRHQSQGCLTPRKLKAQHHSTPRLVKNS